jgi:hypothetical protein
MNSSLHKKPSLTSGITSKATAKSNINPDQVENLSIIDFKKETDYPQFLKQEAKKKIERYLNEDILFEYLRYIAGSNEVTRHLWEIVQNQERTHIRQEQAFKI